MTSDEFYSAPPLIQQIEVSLRAGYLVYKDLWDQAINNHPEYFDERIVNAHMERRGQEVIVIKQSKM